MSVKVIIVQLSSQESKKICRSLREHEIKLLIIRILAETVLNEAPKAFRILANALRSRSDDRAVRCIFAGDGPGVLGRAAGTSDGPLRSRADRSG